MNTTIKQLADTCSVSKTAIRKKLTPEFRAKYTTVNADGTIIISDEGCKLIAESFRKPLETTANQAETVSTNQAETTANLPQTTANQAETDIIAFLKSQIESKDNLINQLMQQNSELTAALQSAQALHAGTIKQQLIEDNSEPEQPAEPKEPEEPAPKLSFFKRWFG